MSGKFNPFHSKQTEVLRIHSVTTRDQALKRFEKLQRKKPCVWAEIQGFTDPGAEQTLNGLDGETNVVLFIAAILDKPIEPPLPPAVDALVTRLWKSFKKLYLIQRIEPLGEGAPEAEDDAE